MSESSDRLAIHGGPKAVAIDPGNTFTWPIITHEDEHAVLDVLRRGGMSDLDVTVQFEQAAGSVFDAAVASLHICCAAAT